MLPIFQAQCRTSPIKHLKPRFSLDSLRYLHQDGRARLSSMWLPTGGIARKKAEEATCEKEPAHSLLIRAGYIRQSQPGIFHFLPLGLRVQEKIEKLIDKHMQRIGASKLSLSSISSQLLWEESNRLGSAQELFTFEDRRGSGLLLSPTHEEEITALVSGIVKSYKELPLRLYQIGRKYRDEARPRAGLLRAREFIMKDLYTFDVDVAGAQSTYESVCQAYNGFFEELRIPFVVAAADSGNMGGKISHEYHLPSPNGEDLLITCPSCGFVKNEEYIEDKECLFKQVQDLKPEVLSADEWRECLKRINRQLSKLTYHSTLQLVENKVQVSDTIRWQGVTKDRRGLVEAFCLAGNGFDGRDQINPYAVKAAIPDVDLGVEDPIKEFHGTARKEKARANTDDTEDAKQKTVYCLFDHTLSESEAARILETRAVIAASLGLNCVHVTMKTAETKFELKKVKHGDKCPACTTGLLQLRTSIELGHTFLLGTRYSAIFNATATVPPSFRKDGAGDQVPLQMGCHGIGISRIIAAAASHLSDSKGLGWPRAIAPFECLVIPVEGCEEDAERVYDAIVGPAKVSESSRRKIDVVLDDRDKSFTWKLKDGDMIGIPVVIIVGKAWKENRKLEARCRNLGVHSNHIALEDVRSEVMDWLDQL